MLSKVLPGKAALLLCLTSYILELHWNKSSAASWICLVFQQASQKLTSQPKWLRAFAASERLTRELGNMSQRMSAALQPTASALGKALGLAPQSTDIFAEEVVRGLSAATLAQLVAILVPALRQLAGMSSWQVISPASGPCPLCISLAVDANCDCHILTHP